MKELIEDYRRRLSNLSEVLDDALVADTGSRNDIAKIARLKTKQGEYRTIIAELERSYRNYIKSKMDALTGAYDDATSGGATGGTIRALIMLTIELANDMGIEVEVEWVGETKYTMK